MSIATWAARYVERFNFALTPLEGKRPFRDAWNEDAQLIRSANEARRYWTDHPAQGIGACLEPSGLVSLDADHEETERILATEGIDLGQLIANTPTILGRRPRLEFAAPHGLRLEKRVVQWPDPADPRKRVTIFELRAGRVQDVLPPSIHPGTGQPYRWITPPVDGFPPVPDKLLALWRDFENFRRRARNLCPWAEPMPAEEPRPLRSRRAHTGPSVIAAFNEVHEVTAILKAHGYTKSGKRWKSPHAKLESAPGIVILGERVFCHHSDDVLGDERAHDAFDLFCLFNHGGDVRAATKAAAEVLGMSARRA